MLKEVKFFIVNKNKTKGFLSYIMNQKSNAIMNISMPFPLGLFSHFKAIVLEFILSFFISDKVMRTSNFASLYHLLFGKLLDQDHHLLEVIFNTFVKRLTYHKPSVLII